MSRTKVMWFIKGLGTGGAERLLTTSIPYIDRNRFDYEVAFCVASQSDLVPEFKKAHIPVFCLDMESNCDPRIPYRLLRLIQDREPQVLHTHLPFTGILGRVIGRICGIKNIVYTEHSVLEMYHPLTRFFNLITYPLIETPIMVSEEVKHSVMKHRMARGKCPIVIHNGVDLIHVNLSRECQDKIREDLGIPANHKVIGNVAHIRPEKGHTYLVKTAKLVINQHPDVTFVIVGREDAHGEISRLKKLAEELGIQQRIIFTGFQRDVFKLMSIFDVFILTSLYEGLSVALLEAMSMGKPAIAPRVGGIPEVIKDGLSGFLVPARDPETMAEKISQILKSRALYNKMSRNAVQTVQKQFSIQEMVRQLEHVYSTY